MQAVKSNRRQCRANGLQAVGMRWAICGLLLIASATSVHCPIPGARSASANEMYDFKMPPFQQWLRENHYRRQPSEGDTDFSRRVFLARRPGAGLARKRL